MAVGGLLAVRKLVYSVDVARYAALIQAKSPTNCNAHLAESIFQTRSRSVSRNGLQIKHMLITPLQGFS